MEAETVREFLADWDRARLGRLLAPGILLQIRFVVATIPKRRGDRQHRQSLDTRVVAVASQEVLTVGCAWWHFETEM
jgi:hypothetical protein